MKSVKFAVSAVAMLAFSSASAGFSDGFAAGNTEKSGSFEGFYSNGYHYSVEISGNEDDTFSMSYGDSQGAFNITRCTASARMEGERLVLVTPKACLDIEIDSETGTENVTKKYEDASPLVYEIIPQGLNEIRKDDPKAVTRLKRTGKAEN